MEVCDNLKFHVMSFPYVTNCLNGMGDAIRVSQGPSPAGYGVLGLILRSGLALAMPSNCPHLKFVYALLRHRVICVVENMVMRHVLYQYD